MRIRGARRRLAIDTPVYLTPYAPAAERCGITQAVRYIRRRERVDQSPNTDGWCRYLSVQELGELLERDWYVGLVQRGIGSGPWRTAADGRALGLAAGRNAQGLGIPAGASIGCDCEWATPPGPAEIRDYLDAWGAAVDGLGYTPALYVSTDVDVLGREGLYRRPSFRGYWGSASAVSGVAVRGYQIRQTLQYDLRTDGSLHPVSSWKECKGAVCDLDVMQIDGRGDRWQMIAA
jgi:hypothetical protein